MPSAASVTSRVTSSAVRPVLTTTSAPAASTDAIRTQCARTRTVPIRAHVKLATQEVAGLAVVRIDMSTTRSL